MCVSIGSQWDRERERERTTGGKKNATGRSESYERKREHNEKKNAIGEKKKMRVIENYSCNAREKEREKKRERERESYGKKKERVWKELLINVIMLIT